MSLNATPQGERVHIGLFGRRNSGKSSLINAITGQNLAIVSETLGTTTDPVYKSMELLPMGPVTLIDTPGFDDEGALGEMRVKKTKQVLNKTDIALLVVDTTLGRSACDDELLQLFEEKQIPHLVVMNKAELAPAHPLAGKNELYVSALTKEGIFELKERIAHTLPQEENTTGLIEGLICAGDTAVLVVPIDSAAPKGRLILPQQQVIRDILDHGAAALVVQADGLSKALAGLREKPKLVITDSQAFRSVAQDTPEDILLTSFSILMARHKGVLEQSVRGVSALLRLQDGDRVLLSEGCTHHRQCGDIGTVKIPRWLAEFTDKQIQIETSSGTEFPDELGGYAAIIHCGGCMLGAREMRWRMKRALEQGVPMTNYGVCIAQMSGILKRSLAPFPELLALL